jgi:hypothetical protein
VLSVSLSYVKNAVIDDKVRSEAVATLVNDDTQSPDVRYCYVCSFNVIKAPAKTPSG